MLHRQTGALLRARMNTHGRNLNQPAPMPKPQAKPSTAKVDVYFHPRMSASECAGPTRRTLTTSGKQNAMSAAFLELTETPSGQLFGTLVLISPKPLNDFIQQRYAHNFKESLVKNGPKLVKEAEDSNKGTVRALAESAREGTLKATAKVPEEAAKTAQGPKVASGAKAATRPSSKPKKPARKKAKGGTTGGAAAKTKAKAKSPAAKKGAAKVKAQKKKPANVAKSNAGKSNAGKSNAGKGNAVKSNAPKGNADKRPAPPPPAIPPETNASLMARHQRELEALGLAGNGAVSGNISQFPVAMPGEVSGYKFGAGVEASYGDPRQAPLSGLQPGVTIGGTSPLPDLYPGTIGGVTPLPDMYPGTAGGTSPLETTSVVGVPPARAKMDEPDAKLQEKFEAAWQRFKANAAMQAGNTAAGAPISLDAYADQPMLYP